MLYYFFALIFAAATLFFTNPHSERNRWGAFFLASASIGGLSDWLGSVYSREAALVVQLLNHTLTPYGVMIFSFVYAVRLRKPRQRIYAKLLLLLPPAAMLVIYAAEAEPRLHYALLLIWTVPYYLLACYLLVHALWREQDLHRRRSRFITTMIMVPTLLAVLLLINVGKVVNSNFDYFPYISLFMLYSLTVAAICSFLYGVLGVKLRIENDPLENTMKLVSSGAALLNHTLKNEIGKIAISSDNMRHELAARPGNDDLLGQLQIIENASRHMQEMVNRIQSQMKDILLREQPVQLARLVEELVQEQTSAMNKLGIKTKTSYSCFPILRSDPVHLKEAIGNLISNAREAMPGGGELTIAIERFRSSVRLLVRDTGIGIGAAQLEQVLQPFFSTKGKSSNFGLGLSYVYKVMRKSGGELKIRSCEGEGTAVELYFARNKVLHVKGEASDGRAD
ncbi:sensor histidine kinase [Paenibacillus sp. HB172176]|uniref:sensor histidine kinase n=1 Tax=Paenibacillus sp. HB172176 TaxID=2493690 RepID=UPI00143B2997|nr:sensor histidine kinase [Paenibacillus sp. HB172176]